MAQETELKELPPPTSNDTLGATHSKTIVVERSNSPGKRGRGRPDKGLQALTLKLTPIVLEQFRGVEAATKGKGKAHSTRSDLIAAMIRAYKQSGTTIDPIDEKAGRTAPSDVVMQPERLAILRKLANDREKTVSHLVGELIERGRQHAELSIQFEAMQAKIIELEGKLGKRK